MNQERIQTFQKFLVSLVAYTILVILWGAWVRISHSGDGCGDTWPLCRGQMIPDAEQRKTWVEYAHRLMSGLYGIIVIALYFGGRKIFPKEHLARKIGFWTLFFMLTEALLGAKLVLFKLVGSNDSFFRLFAMTLHQINSLLLVGSTVIWALLSQQSVSHTLQFRKKYYYAFILVAVTGAWAALSTTLFPSEGLLSGLSQDFSRDSHFILRLRILHPIIALTVGSFFAIYFWKISDKTNDPKLKTLAICNSGIFIFAMLFGIFTLAFLSPIWMKLGHLAIAHLLWISLLNYAVISADANKR